MIGPVSSPTQSYWLAHLSPQLLPTPSPAPPEAVDIAIIGAGMTGSALAYWLSVLAPGSEQKSIAILDARGVAGGATGRNGGHLWPNPASDFEAEQTAELLKFISDFDVDCDLTLDGAAAFERAQPESGVEYADTPDDPENANQEEDWGDDLLTWDAARCSEAVGTDSFSHATYYPKAAQFYPAKVAAALLRHAKADYFCAPVRVLSMDLSSPDGEREGKGATERWHTLSWAMGDGQEADGVLRARQVAVCTNGWAADLLPELSNYLYPTRNSVIMTEPLPSAAQWDVGGLSVDSDVGARELYAIRRPDGRVCLGGARALEPGAAVGSRDDASLDPTVSRYLRRFLEERWGGVAVEAEWSGVLGFTRDGKPLVGPLPTRPGVFVAAGFNGHGMPQCFGAGKALACMLLGGAADGAQRERQARPHPHLLEVADPSRFDLQLP